jgi:hypothetical protein
MIYSFVNKVATADGMAHDTLELARGHELELLFSKCEQAAGTNGMCRFIVANWPRILEIMTNEPGAEKPKARKRRKDFGTTRPQKAATNPMD